MSTENTKQMEFTKKEQDLIQKSLTVVSRILIGKKDEGFEKPEITGTINVHEENTKITFTITAEDK